MFRTRDLVLFFVIVLFLVAAIGVTTVKKYGKQSADFVIPSVAPEITEVIATVPESNDDSLSRAERLKEMQQKISNSELVAVSETVEEEEMPVDSSVIVSTDRLASPLKCNDYVEPLLVNWPVGGVKTEFIEGARQYYVETNVSMGSTSTSTLTNKTILLTLQSHFLPFGSQNCLSNDVIGVALDGSLMRNSDASLYSLFSNQTLVGYALDGFPIYGAGTSETDDCGGRIELGQYRYEISTDRANIINCFASEPQTIGS